MAVSTAEIASASTAVLINESIPMGPGGMGGDHQSTCSVSQPMAPRPMPSATMPSQNKTRSLIAEHVTRSGVRPAYVAHLNNVTASVLGGKAHRPIVLGVLQPTERRRCGSRIASTGTAGREAGLGGVTSCPGWLAQQF
jgi:hypothetical protein